MQVEITVVPKEKIKITLNAWESEDQYYSGMSKSVASILNMKARKFPYMESSEMSPEATSLLQTPVPIQGPLNIVYLDARSDAGLPHTRGMKGLALPVFLLWHPSEKTIQHEVVHLSQKQFSDRWWNWYKKHWNFRLASDKEFLSIPESWRSRRRINPDTLKQPYTIWKDRYIPLSVFSNELNPDLRYCKRGFWDTKMSQWTWEAPSGWDKTFGSGFNDEHPNEISAHWIDGSAGKEKKAYFDLNPI